ncbi:MAG: cytochrome c oxidase accessory protein CcoG [Phycisphaerales bacterium]|nr:MAG: cytochrome c oxidase accessory protein CcoG [Phycisphaerales bacterium]
MVAPSQTNHEHAPSARPEGTLPPDSISVLSTLRDDGSRRWLKPRPSPGKFWNRRRAVAYILIAIFTLIPYIKLGGHPIILLDVAHRKFHIFGTTFLPTDTLFLALLVLSVFVTIFLLTALFGRVWCGWACPQTVYMEFLFRPIERFFDGTPGRAKKGFLQTTPVGRVLKYITFFVISCYLAHTFLAYFVGVDQLRVWVTRSPFEHSSSFLVMAVVTGLMLFDFGFFREQTCLVACPYGRFQSVLLDRNSLIVSYNNRRGEPRGKARKPASSSDVSLPVVQGDCVDCGLCVATCPTGIDIRNGLQMECIHCTQCMDACDAVMTKLGRDPGLIRYSSTARNEGEVRKRFRPRVIVYPTILTILLTTLGVLLTHRDPVDATILRARGIPFTELDSGEIGNNFSIKLVNRLDHATSVTLTPHKGITGIMGVSGPIALEVDETKSVPVMLVAPPEGFHSSRLAAEVLVTGEEKFEHALSVSMIGPAKNGSVKREPPSSSTSPSTPQSAPVAPSP